MLVGGYSLNTIITMFLLAKLRNMKIAFLFEFGYAIFIGRGQPPLPLDILTFDIPYIQMFYISLLSYAIA